MSDFFSTAVAMQHEIIAAQKAQLDAARTMLDPAADMADAETAGRKVAEANAKALTAWAGLWGWL